MKHSGIRFLSGPRNKAFFSASFLDETLSILFQIPAKTWTIKVKFLFFVNLIWFNNTTLTKFWLFIYKPENVLSYDSAMQMIPATFLGNRYEFDICMLISEEQSIVLSCLDFVLNYIGCDIGREGNIRAISSLIRPTSFTD